MFVLPFLAQTVTELVAEEDLSGAGANQDGRETVGAMVFHLQFK